MTSLYMGRDVRKNWAPSRLLGLCCCLNSFRHLSSQPWPWSGVGYANYPPQGSVPVLGVFLSSGVWLNHRLADTLQQSLTSCRETPVGCSHSPGFRPASTPLQSTAARCFPALSWTTSGAIPVAVDLQLLTLQLRGGLAHQCWNWMADSCVGVWMRPSRRCVYSYRSFVTRVLSVLPRGADDASKCCAFWFIFHRRPPEDVVFCY